VFVPLPKLLQKPGVTISFVIPTLISLDKMLESRLTSYTHFSKALRTGLQSHLQPLILQRDLILATVLDPRIKLQVSSSPPAAPGSGSVKYIHVYI